MAENGTTLRQRKTGTNGSAQPTDVGKESDARLDKHETYEFGGPWGVTAMVFGFPVLMYYLWICLWFYDGQLVHPSSVADIQPFIGRILIPVGDIREGHREFLLLSSGMPTAATGPFRPKLGDYALRNEYEVMRVELDQLESYSEILLWAEEKRQSIAKRRKEAVYVDRFLQMMGLARRQEIQRRLMKMGWEANDMNFHTTWSTGRINWQSLVSKIKPITDKDWAILEPKLIPLLEINRKERIQVDNQAKATLFAPMIRRMKDTLPLDFTAHPRHPRKDIPLFPIVVYRAPLPPINRVLEWPVVKTVYGADSATIVDLGASFNQHRQEIEAHIVEWQSNTHRAFRDMVQREHEALGFPLDPAVAVGPDRSDLFAGLSDDLKCLLRADVLFTDTSGPRGKNRPLLSYSEISSQADWDSPEYRLDPSQISLDTKALRVAREILKSMHEPFASYLEMGRYGAYYVCGRCHDTSPKTWKMLVQHYSFADKICALFQKNSTAENGITYNHIHHPAFNHWKPMIIPAHQAIHCLEKSKPSQNPHCVCMVCDTFIFKGAVSGPESGIIQHLSDVHNIVGPTKDVHYRRTTIPLSRRFTPEDSDSDDEINH
ncbi:unnamed protein product [Rhizoctonia solani]|uniref:Uncharacterized protein n=1 Tax=Rhizoctonia solani TaxID=456999 RepID=A0A8H3E112_9AGAM|nr:unnamed protein product [Rhizoctonia solani]